MDPEQGLSLTLLDITGRRHVSQDHALFDQLMSVVTHQGHNAFNLALRVEDEAGLLAFKLDSPTHMTRRLERLIQLMQLLDVADQWSILLAQLGIPVENRRHLGISQARMGVHHRLEELVARHAARFADGHLADHTQTINLRVQGT